MGIVLVGTHPWANSAFDKLLPRPLLPVGHRPLISYALSWLRESGIRTAAVCGNRETRALESRLHRHVPAGLALSYQEDQMPRGAAGAIRDAAFASDADCFVIVDGTTIPNVDLRHLLKTHLESGAPVTAVVHAERARNGASSIQVPTGIYVFNRGVLDVVPSSGFYDIKETLIPQLHRNGTRILPYAVSTAGPRVLDASSYLALNEWVIEHLAAADVPPDDYVRNGMSLIHREASVADDASLIGPVLVGPGAQIMPGAVVVGPTSIGRDAIIGPGVLVSRSAIWRRCQVRENAMTDRCILGDGTILGAGIQAFRQVRMAGRHRPAEFTRDTREVQESSIELFRRVGRALLGTTWSRYPAAQ